VREAARRGAVAGLRAVLLVAAGFLALHAPPARADLRAAVDWARLHACAGTRPAPLSSDRRLRTAAVDLSAGYSLRRALATAGVIASRSSLLRLSGASTDTQVARALTGAGCAGALADPGFRRYGAARRGGQLWIVLASADSPPRGAGKETFDREVLRLVNRARSVGRLCGDARFAAAPPLHVNPALTAAAAAHSRDMAAHGLFSHRGRDGSAPGQRVRRAGYGAYRIVGENIAAGAMTPAQVMRGWLASPGHCANIMDPRFREIGIDYAVDAASASGIYWTEDFAAPVHAMP